MPTTYYDLITRFSVEDRGSEAIGKYRLGADRTDRSLGALVGTTRSLGFAKSALFSTLAPLTGGMIGLGSVGLAVRQTFSNLNTELNATISVAARLNAFFTYAANPVDNFTEAMKHSKSAVRDLTRDAAKLPGTLSDFLQIQSAIASPVFEGGGNVERVRQMVGRLALVAPMSQGSPAEAGRQAMRILQGTASVGDNPLFVAMRPFFERGGRKITSTEEFNKLPAAERLEILDNALKKLADNPMFREAMIRTFDTQLSSLADNLFGVAGIGGQIMESPFNLVLDWLVDFNKDLTAQTPEIVTAFDQIVASAYAIVGVASAVGDLLPVKLAMSVMKFGLTGGVGGVMYGAMSGDDQEWIKSLIPGRDTYLAESNYLAEKRTLAEVKAEFAAEDAKKFSPSANDLTKQQIEQNFTIHVDLKSDTNPEAIAVRMVEAMGKLGRNPVMTRRAIGHTPEP